MERNSGKRAMKFFYCWLTILFTLCAVKCAVNAQTRLDLATQAKRPFPEDTVFLNSIYAQLEASNLYGIGMKQIFRPSKETAGARIVCDTTPTALTGGDLGCTPAGVFWHVSGAQTGGIDYHVVNRTQFSGDGNLPQFSGSSGTLLSDSTVAVSSLAIRVSAPATSSDPCSPGQYSSDSNFHYDCIAPNVWVRSSAATW